MSPYVWLRRSSVKRPPPCRGDLPRCGTGGTMAGMPTQVLAEHSAAILLLCGVVKRYAPGVFRLGLLPKRLLWVVPFLVAVASALIAHLQQGLSVHQAAELGAVSFFTAMGGHALVKQLLQSSADEGPPDSGRVLLPPALLVFVLAGCTAQDAPRAADAVRAGACVSAAWEAAEFEGRRVCQDRGLTWDNCPDAVHIEDALGEEIDRCLAL